MLRRLTEGCVRGTPIFIDVDGIPIATYSGETIAAALLASGVVAFRADRDGEPRGPYCNMGVCYDCLVVIEGDAQPWVRACLEPVRDAMRIRTRPA
jgi:hypothetical protein